MFLYHPDENAVAARFDDDQPNAEVAAGRALSKGRRVLKARTGGEMSTHNRSGRPSRTRSGQPPGIRKKTNDTRAAAAATAAGAAAVGGPVDEGEGMEHVMVRGVFGTVGNTNRHNGGHCASMTPPPSCNWCTREIFDCDGEHGLTVCPFRHSGVEEILRFLGRFCGFAVHTHTHTTHST